MYWNIFSRNSCSSMGPKWTRNIMNSCIHSLVTHLMIAYSSIHISWWCSPGSTFWSNRNVASIEKLRWTNFAIQTDMSWCTKCMNIEFYPMAVITLKLDWVCLNLYTVPNSTIFGKIISRKLIKVIHNICYDSFMFIDVHTFWHSKLIRFYLFFKAIWKSFNKLNNNYNK